MDVDAAIERSPIARPDGRHQAIAGDRLMGIARQQNENAILGLGQMYELAAALAYMKRIGLDKIEAQSMGLARQLRKGLADRGFRLFTPEGNESSIVSFYAKKSSRDVQAVLDADRVKVSLQAEGAEGSEAAMVRIRVAPAFFNNAAEVRRFLDVSDKLTA